MSLRDVSNFNLLKTGEPIACKPKTWTESWILSKRKEEKAPVSIPNNVLKSFGRQDVIVVDFLYRSYKKRLDGVILNEEEDFNPQLQISSFLGALYNSIKNKFLVAVLCPDNSIIKWHYYMSQCGNFEVKIINSTTVPEDFDKETGIVLLLSFTNIKLADYLKEYDFASVVIDNFDQIATKLAIRKFKGHFNIGVTSRNFYVNRDQKIQWTMLNWANLSCVGKLANFYKIDDDNFANSRDNYKEWWFRLTWNFCDSFVKPTSEEKEKLNSILKEWGKAHNLIESYQLKNIRKRKVNKAGLDVEEESSEDEKPRIRFRKIYNKKSVTTKRPKKIIYKTTPNKGTNTKNKQDFHSVRLPSDFSDSSDTIIYENDSYQKLDGDDKDLSAPENDEPPIGGPVENDQVLDREVAENVSLEKHLEKINVKDECMDESASSGEQLLCSLVRTKKKKSLKKTKPTIPNNALNESSDIFDESDLFLKSVATTSSDLSPLKNRKKAEDFFDRILAKSGEKKPEFNPLTQMEIELTEKEVLDVPSESDNFFSGVFKNNKSHNELSDKTETKELCSQDSDDSFFKGIFNSMKKTKKDRIKEKEADNCSQSSNVSVDVDKLVAEVMEMVGGK